MEALIRKRNKFIDVLNKTAHAVLRHQSTVDHEPLTVARVESLKKTILKLEVESENLETQIYEAAAATDQDDTKIHDDAHKILNTFFFELPLALDDIMAELTKKEEPKKPENESSESGESDEEEKEEEEKKEKPKEAKREVESNHGFARLPKIELPKFDGNVLDWTAFHDMFVAEIHNKSLSGCQKLFYLKSCLIGKPLTMVSEYPTTNSSYKSAWEALISRHQKSRVLIYAQLDKLFTQPVIQIETAESLRDLVDTTSKCKRALKVLGCPVDSWDEILMYLVCTKLPPTTRQAWELHYDRTEDPAFTELIEYLEDRADALTASSLQQSTSTQKEIHNEKKSNPKSSYNLRNKKTSSHHSSSKSPVCVLCKGAHYVNKCDDFLKLSTRDRLNVVKENSCCFNCLYKAPNGQKGHTASECKRGSCRVCEKKHHTTLHFEKVETDQSEQKTGLHGFASPRSHVLLSTALVNVKDKNNENIQCRVLLDSGSEASFISENCVSRLGLKRKRFNVEISGLGASNVESTRGIVNIQVSSRHSDFHLNVNTIILQRVTGLIPRVNCERGNWSHIKGLKLADELYYKPGEIDILLGSDYLATLMRSERRLGPMGTPVAQESVFGWVLSGPTQTTTNQYKISSHTCQLESILKNFWEVEDCDSNPSNLSTEELKCEQLFEKTHRRDESGRYTVKLPFRENSLVLGDSLHMAMKRFLHMEKKLQSNPELKKQYVDFMREYESLGHMIFHGKLEDVKCENKSNQSVYYLPHHPVIKESSSTTKLRVVFDASAKSSSGVSLNDKLMVGPKLQSDLFSLLLRFRFFIVPLTADVTKMFRQFLVNTDDADFQRVLWREIPTDELKVYKLITVTYGTGSASYLATKCLQQLAKDHMDTHPLAAKAVLRDYYMDDLLSGGPSEDETLQLQQQLMDLMKLGGLELRKWASSYPSVLSFLPPEMCEVSSPYLIDSEEIVKTLGITWIPSTDDFSFRVCVNDNAEPLTKRALLSDLARLFDPLGWLSPVTIVAKIIMQQCWKAQSGWDEELPSDIQNLWSKYRSELNEVEKIKIPRCVVMTESEQYEIHGFSDASGKAYSAVVYLRTVSQCGEVKVSLLASKTKVAPIKTQTIPRLELCGALLLCELMKSIKLSLDLNIDSMFGWTDAQIVLCWLASDSNRWKPFVSNRVKKIQDFLPSSCWFHVSGEENPADVASRGISPSKLQSHHLWWHGPHWLKNPEVHTTTTKFDSMEAESEARVMVQSHHHQLTDFEQNIMTRFSSLSKLQRFTAIWLRYISNLKHKTQMNCEPISCSELHRALMLWVKKVQNVEFCDEIKLLSENKSVSHRSKLFHLNPFIDSCGILRVGGRLSKSSLPESQKHPIVLPRKGELTQLIVSHYHEINLHAGPSLLLAALHQRFWIINGRDVVRQCVKKCVKCYRLTASVGKQMMGELSAARVNQCRAFLKCGVDYAGPVFIRTTKNRMSVSRAVNSKVTNPKLVKSYICLFVCFVTRAIHLELVSDLSTDCFLSALKRFISRRGKPSEIYSDNGTNFIGANRQLKEMEHLTTRKNQNQVISFLSGQSIQWITNPPGAPHFGGLWEAGVKSTKKHLRAVIGNHHLTFEEMTTLLTQIEACLNSRPLTPLSTDPSDLSVLTPGHFLIGDALTTTPEPDLMDLPMNRLSRWQHIQQLFQHFWKRWTSEYMNRLQQRPKWVNSENNMKIGDIVLVKDENLSPLKWPLGRIVNVYSGSDGLVRVADVKTATNELKRPIHKLSLLPIDNLSEK